MELKDLFCDSLGAISFSKFFSFFASYLMEYIGARSYTKSVHEVSQSFFSCQCIVTSTLTSCHFVL